MKRPPATPQAADLRAITRGTGERAIRAARHQRLSALRCQTRCHDPAMDTAAATFWDIIEAARASAGSGNPFHEVLVGPSNHRYWTGDPGLPGKVRRAAPGLYRWELWAAAYLIGGGRSDDSFIDFRAGLIAQGRDWYDKAAASPDSLADHSAVSGYRPSPLGQPAVLRGSQLRRLLCVPAANRR